METIWNSVLSEIEFEVSKPIFITFFKNTKLIGIEDSVATISARTPIIAEHIEKRHIGLIKKILDRLTEKNLQIIIVSKGKTNGEKKITTGPLFAQDVKRVSGIHPPRVRKEYTFEAYAVSESNRLAYTAALTVAKNPGVKYNPLYLYGTVGVGKTHLMHSIANQVFGKISDFRITYLTTEEFTNEVVEAIRDKTTNQLRRKFRNADLLLLDDIQFLSGKERVQEELFHTFNTLIDKGKQIVLSSDRPPSEIQKIDSRLASRFEGGLTVDVQPPDFELRTAILLIKAEKYAMDMTIDIAKIIAEKITDARALEGFLLRITTELSARNQTLSDQLVYEILGKKKDRDPGAQPDSIIQTVCSYYGIKSTQLKGVKRDASLVLPRHICMFILKEETRLTYVEIGNLLGGRDHTTVMHAVGKIKLLLSNSERVKGEIVFIKKRIKTEYLHL